MDVANHPDLATTVQLSLSTPIDYQHHVHSLRSRRRRKNKYSASVEVEGHLAIERRNTPVCMQSAALFISEDASQSGSVSTCFDLACNMLRRTTNPQRTDSHNKLYDHTSPYHIESV